MENPLCLKDGNVKLKGHNGQKQYENMKSFVVFKYIFVRCFFRGVVDGFRVLGEAWVGLRQLVLQVRINLVKS